MGRQADFGREPVYTPAQIAAALSVTAETVRRWIRAGELESFKVRRGHRVKQSSLDAYVASFEQDNDAAAATA